MGKILVSCFFIDSRCILHLFHSRDVSELELQFECCWSPTIVDKSEIRRIYRLVYIGFGLTVCCIKLSFIIHCHLSSAMQK